MKPGEQRRRPLRRLALRPGSRGASNDAAPSPAAPGQALAAAVRCRCRRLVSSTQDVVPHLVHFLVLIS